MDAHREAQREMVDQLEDYVIPRVTTLEAPLLAVVGGSTGAGKSTLVNSLVGEKVTMPGLLRPTTRSPVLVHHPDDASWFGQDRLLPDLERVSFSTNDPGALQLVPSDAVPQGLAILDAPDVDSVEERNRELAAQLLAAADLWIFVTSAARYADQVPWDFLRQAAERSTAVAIVLDRTPEEAVARRSRTHLARMLASRGLKDSPLFVVREGPVDDDGLLPPELRRRGAGLAQVAGRGLHRPRCRGAADPRRRGPDPHHAHVPGGGRGRRPGRDRRSGCARTPRRPTTTRSPPWSPRPPTGRCCAARCSPAGRSSSGPASCSRASRPRWAGSGTAWSTPSRAGPQQAERVTVAVESGLELLILEHAEAAAERAEASWQQLAAGQGLLRDAGRRPRPGVP